MTSGWIFEFNLLPWVRFVAGLCEYDLHPWEIDYFETSIADTDEELGKWLDYEFAGTTAVHLRLAAEGGGSENVVEVDCPPELEPRIKTAIEMAQAYRLVPIQ